MEFDDQIIVSMGLILNGQLGDLKKIRQLILDFVGAELTEEGYVRQCKPWKTSVRWIRHQLSSKPLYLTRERPWSLERGEVKTSE